MDYSVKMSDGTRYDFKADKLEWIPNDKYLIVKNGNKKVLLNEMHIVSITSKGDGDDS